MAKKKKEEAQPKGSPAWMNTFADLMNLLLCFFVLLFAMSTIDAEKFEQISISLANTFSIFDGGGSAIGKGQLISSGMTQLNNLDEYFSNMGENSSNSEIKNNGNNPSNADSDAQDKDDSTDVSKAIKQIEDEMKQLSGKIYDEVSDLTQQYNLGDYLELSIDPEFQYVKLNLSGSILFDSGEADVKEEAKPILSKIGDILKKYDEYLIEIVGHTDNVPMNSAKFKNNNWLSSARALNTAEYLIRNKALAPSKLKYSGRGEYEPIASNTTAAGRAKNRRIEIKIYNEISSK